MNKLLTLALAVGLVAACGKAGEKNDNKEKTDRKPEEVIWTKSFLSELEFELQNPCMEEEDEPINVFVPRKVCQVDHQWSDTEDQSTLVHHLWKAWSDKRMVGFSDQAMKNQFTFDQAKLLKDTFFTMPMDGTPSTQTFQAFLQSPHEITGFKVQQSISYDKANGRFVWNAAAIGLIRNNDKVLVWFPVSQMPVFVDMNTPDIGWAYSARMNNVFLEADTTETETGDLLAAKNDFIKQFLNSPDLEYYNGIPLKKSTQAERAKSIETSDTIVSFDPKTFEQEVKISKTKLSAEVFNSLTFKTTWAFDSKRGQLMARMDFFRPQIELFNDDPNLKFKISLATCK